MLFMRTIQITAEEQKAIKSLKLLAKKWPKTLMLFSWSGSLNIFKQDKDGMNCVVDLIPNIPNDGGDPNMEEDVADAEIVYI